MKKIIFLGVVMFGIATFFIINEGKNLDGYEENKLLVVDNSEIRAFFFSYLEFEKYIMNEDDNGAKKNIDTIISNMKRDKFFLL
jgi:hypothetical protein